MPTLNDENAKSVSFTDLYKFVKLAYYGKGFKLELLFTNTTDTSKNDVIFKSGQK